MGSTTWRGTGDCNFYDQCKVEKHPKQNKNVSISYPGTPRVNQEETILSKVNSVEDKIEQMKELIKKLDEWENKPAQKYFNTKTIKSDNMSEVNNNITRLKKEIVDQKQYLDLCVYDDALLNCLPDMSDLENVDIIPINITSQSMLSSISNNGKKVKRNVKKIHSTNKIDSCATDLKLNNEKANIQQELLDITSCGKKSLHGAKIASVDSVESTRAVKSKKNKKKSLSVKNKKQKFAKSKNLNKNSMGETKAKSKTTMIKAMPSSRTLFVSKKNICNKYKVTKSKYLEKPIKHEINNSDLENIEMTNIVLAPVSEDIGEFEKEVERLTEPQFNQFVPAHYTQSTVSSRMKQIDRSFYSRHDFKYPFVLGQSTNKSHNLGVNIQQILSLLKKKRVSKSSISVKTNVSTSCALSVLTKTSKRFYCPAIAEGDEDVNDEVSDFKTPWERMQKEYEFVNTDSHKLKPRCICVGNFVNRKYLRSEEDKEESVLKHLDSSLQNQFNKIKSTSSVYWASVLRQIKQYKLNLENTLPKPSIPV